MHTKIQSVIPWRRLHFMVRQLHLRGKLEVYLLVIKTYCERKYPHAISAWGNCVVSHDSYWLELKTKAQMDALKIGEQIHAPHLSISFFFKICLWVAVACYFFACLQWWGQEYLELRLPLVNQFTRRSRWQMVMDVHTFWSQHLKLFPIRKQLHTNVLNVMI